METKDLEEYLGIIVDLEQNVFLQKQLMLGLHHKISTLCKPKEIAAPGAPPDLSKTPLLPMFVGCLLGCILVSAVAALVVDIPIALFISFLDNHSSAPDYIWLFLTVIFSLGSFALVCGGLISNDRENKKQYAQYESAFASYQKACLDEKARMNRETQLKEVLLEELHHIETQNQSTARILANMYGLNIIHEEYRTFPRVCTLYDYIRTGICHSLYGDGGAYKLLRQEELLGKIVSQLDLILRELQSIKENQFMLYCAIQEGNQKLNDIMSGINQISELIRNSDNSKIDPQQLDSLQKNSKLIAYNTERIEKELHYINRMNYFAGKYDDAGIFLRRPPV